MRVIGVVFLIGAFQLVLLLLWWNVHTLSKLEQQQQPEVNSSYLSIPSGSIEVPYDAKAFLRGRVSLGAKDCHNALGKKGWDYVVRCDSSQCMVAQNAYCSNAEGCPSIEILTESVHNIFNVITQSNCMGNSFCVLPLSPFGVENLRFPDYNDNARPCNSLGACLINHIGSKNIKIQWWRRNIETIGDKKKKMGGLSRISFCYICDGNKTTGRDVPSHDGVGSSPPPNPASDIGDLWVMGSSGQVFYFTGQPGMWYNIIKDDAITYNWFISECSKSHRNGKEHGRGDKVPCVTGIGLMLNEREIEISIIDPHRISPSCKGPNAPENCISDGNVGIYIDGSLHTATGTLYHSDGLRVSAANLPMACKRENVIEQHFKQQAPERERRWNSRELLSWQSMFGETDSFRDSLVREAAHGHVWDRKACKEWLRNADNRSGGIYTMRGKLSTIEIESPTLSLLIEHHMWVGTEQEIMHRFDVLSKQYTRKGQPSFGIQGATLDLKQRTVTSLKGGSYHIPGEAPIVSMMEVLKSGPENYIVGGPFKSDFPANLQNDL